MDAIRRERVGDLTGRFGALVLLLILLLAPAKLVLRERYMLLLSRIF